MSDAGTVRPIDAGVLQRTASDPLAHAWVSASAGSGKTKVLTDRVLRLLLGTPKSEGTPPHRILAITFTKAAAAEMAARIVQTLSAWATMPDAALTDAIANLIGERPSLLLRDRARRLFTLVLDDAGGLQILTIHGFCQSLLARFPIESGVAPGFRVMEEQESAALLASARDDVLRAAQNGGGDPAIVAAIAQLAALVSPIALGDVLAGFASQQAKLQAAIVRHGSLEGMIAAIARLCGVAPGETSDALLRAACAAESFESHALREAAAHLAEGSENDARKAETLGFWLSAEPKVREASFDSYRSVFLTKEMKIRKPLATKAAAAAVSAMSAEAARLVEVQDRLQRVRLAESSAAAARFAAAVLARYRLRKNQAGLLDFDDLISASVRLLESQTVPSWVMFKLDGGIDHILVDEAQDTNARQWRILARLSEEFMAGEGARDRARTVFAVGDEKQSIFSFQGADPTVFATMRVYFSQRAREAAQNFAPVELNISFRSTQAVLLGVDSVFAHAAARDGVTGDFAHEIHHIAQRRGMAGRVELWPLTPSGESDSDSAWDEPGAHEGLPPAEERLARIVAATIAGWIRDREPLPSRGRAVRAGDILVLVRRRTEFVHTLVRSLKAYGVPVAGIDRMVLKEQLAVQDMLALIAMLLLPEDDLTLAIVLKSPLIGLDDQALESLAARRRGILWLALREAAESGDARLGEIFRYFTELRREADLLPPYALLQHVLDAPCPADAEGSGRRAMLKRLGEEALDPLKELLAAALTFSETRIPSLQSFLAWIEAGGVEIKREMESSAAETVRVMTVHASKGLQAPIVFLADTTSLPRQPETIAWSEGDAPLPLWAARVAEGGAMLTAARERAGADRDAEYRRLLYVALTRAADRLIVCGWENNGKTKYPEGCWYELVARGWESLAAPTPFDTRTLHRFGWEGTALVYDEPQIEVPRADRSETKPHGKAGEKLPAWASEPAPTEPTPSRPLRPSQLDEEPAVKSPLSAEDRTVRFRRGTLIHRLLQFLPELTPDAREAAALRFLALPGHNLPSAQQKALWREVETVLNDPAFSAVFAPGSQAEVPIIGVVGSLSVSGQVDRLVVDSERVLIVDYKSNRPPPATEDGVDPAYWRQMAAYRAVLSVIYPGRAIECALLWTDGPRLMPLSSARLDLHAPGR